MSERVTTKKLRVLISVWEKNEAIAVLARKLYEAGYEIIASSGTETFLKGFSNIEITNTAVITGQEPVLDHRVATLCPALHGGLLAEEQHMEELARLGWPKIDMVIVTFYPLAQAMAKQGATDESINKSVDIGGLTLVSSACKGGRIVVTDEKDFEFVGQLVDDQVSSGFPIEESVIDWFHAVATANVAQYRAMEALFRVRKLRPTF